MAPMRRRCAATSERGVSLATTLDGMVVGTVLLDPVAGAPCSPR